MSAPDQLTQVLTLLEQVIAKRPDAHASTLLTSAAKLVRDAEQLLEAGPEPGTLPGTQQVIAAHRVKPREQQNWTYPALTDLILEKVAPQIERFVDGHQRLTLTADDIFSRIKEAAPETTRSKHPEAYIARLRLEDHQQLAKQQAERHVSRPPSRERYEGALELYINQLITHLQQRGISTQITVETDRRGTRYNRETPEKRKEFHAYVRRQSDKSYRTEMITKGCTEIREITTFTFTRTRETKVETNR